MKNESFKHVVTTKEGYKKIEVNGWILENKKDLSLNEITENYKFGIYKKQNKKRYYVLEISSGIDLTKGFLTRKEALEDARKIISNLTIGRFEELLISSNEYLKKLGLSVS